MAGLNHEFQLIDANSFRNNDRMSYIGKGEVEIHDDIILYINDSIKWIDSLNPCRDEEMKGLCLYGFTVFRDGNLNVLRTVILSWAQLFSVFPERFVLKGSWTAIDEGNLSEGFYQEVEVRKEAIIEKLRILTDLCLKGIEGNKWLLHGGI